jgi:hypothetical protein
MGKAAAFMELLSEPRMDYRRLPLVVLGAHHKRIKVPANALALVFLGTGEVDGPE